ncbi:MAG: undecaprenyl-diphosphatase [Planctomycetota bacterium]
MDWVQASILGFIQGLTEFLPVSSSGHLVLAREMLGLEVAESPAFEVVVHLGTLLSIVVVMRSMIAELFLGLPKLLHPSGWRQTFEQHRGFRHLVLLIPATIPTILVALLLKDEIDQAFGSPQLAASMLLVTAVILYSTRRLEDKQTQSFISFKTIFWMGLAQACAIIPGISRSGSTIAAGCRASGNREQVGFFSFLMALPAILGAAILHSAAIADSNEPNSVLIAGFLTAFLSGTAALTLLLKLVKRGRLWVFSPYLVLVGGGYLLFSIIS